MRNICFLNGDMSRNGGTERMTAIIANELSKKKDKFNVYILNISNSSGNSFYKLDKRITVSRLLDKENVNFKVNYFKVVNGIRRYIKSNDIDVLIDVDVLSDIFSIPAKVFTKTKLISWEHFNCNQNNGTKLRHISRLLASKFSDQIVTLTEKDMDNYIKRFKVEKKIRYIYNPIAYPIKESCNIESKNIVSAGRLSYEKGFDMLVEVANHVLHENKDWTWTILGDGQEKEFLQKKIKEYKLENKLILKGNVSNVEDYYRNSSIYVMTSRYEGLPMTLLEARSFSLPIVSFDCDTGPSEIVKNNINGFLIKNNNLKDMEEKICKLINNIKLKKIFSDNSRIDLEKFNLEKIILKWEKLLLIEEK